MKAILVLTSTNPFFEEELKSLCEACHIEIGDVVIQKLEKINPATYIGKGKIEEIKLKLQDEMVIFDDELTPLQVKNLTDLLETEVTDRTDLILRIFDERAKTKEAKLQVEIARDQYLLPRLVGMQEHMSHQQGGSGFRGSGEKQIELDRRIIARKLARSRKELAEIVKQRQVQRQRRKNNQIPVIALVGYTNSGKSTLLNTLCPDKQKKVFEKDMLFATLETSTRHIKIKNHDCLLTDTVGFIERLPHHLIQAFRSTLEEVKEADLLLHVVDTSFEDYQMQIETTNEVLKSLGVENTPMIYVYNKMDLVHQPIVHEQGICIDVSVKEKKRLDDLENMIIDILFKDYELISVYIPYEEGHIFSEIEYQYEILHTEYLEKEIYVSFYVNQKHKQRYRPYMKKTDSLQ